MFHDRIENANTTTDTHTLRRCAALLHARQETIGRGKLGTKTAANIDDKIRHFIEVDILYQTQADAIPMDLASKRSLSTMHALSNLYQTRMRANIAKGAHPWIGDRLLERDFLTCDRLFEDGPDAPRT